MDEQVATRSSLLALAIPVVWLIVATIRANPLAPVLDEIGDSGEHSTGGSTTIALMLLLVAAALLVLWIRRDLLTITVVRNGALLGLFAFMLVSVLWSGVPGTSAKRWIRGFGSLLAALVVATDERPAEATRRVLATYLGIVIPVSLAMVYLTPSLGRTVFGSTGKTVWVGLTGDKNGFGQLGAVGVIFGAWRVMFAEGAKRRRNLLMLALAAMVLLGAGSVTAIFIAFSGLMILAAAYMVRLGFGTGPLTALFAAILLGAFMVTVMSEAAFSKSPQEILLRRFGKNATLTDRTFLWEDLLALASRTPILGLGYGSYWVDELRTDDLWLEYAWHPNQAHNGYIDVYLEMGAVGLTMLTLTVLSALIWAFTMFRSQIGFGSLRAALIVAACVANISESSFCRLNAMLWCVFLLAAAAPALLEDTSPVYVPDDDAAQEPLDDLATDEWSEHAWSW